MEERVCPQISSQVLIVNAFFPSSPKVSTVRRLTCNFGFLDSWSSPGITPSPNANIRLCGTHKSGSRIGFSPLRLKTIFHYHQCLCQSTALPINVTSSLTPIRDSITQTRLVVSQQHLKLELIVVIATRIPFSIQIHSMTQTNRKEDD
jgi:hypothetical protein